MNSRGNTTCTALPLNIYQNSRVYALLISAYNKGIYPCLDDTYHLRALDAQGHKELNDLLSHKKWPTSIRLKNVGQDLQCDFLF